MKVRTGAGGLLALAVAVLVCVIAGLNWIGAHAHLIGDGIGVLLKVAALCAALAGAWVAARMIWASRHPAPPEPPAPPVQHVTSEQVPLPRAGDPPAALPPGNHYHFGDMTPEAAAELARALRGDDR